jgi:signal transduction histidine kinase
MSQIQVTLRGLEPIALAPETALALYRVIQEALTNIARHSGASRAAIAFATTAGQLQLQIKDNGQGFDPQINTTGFGLRSLQERVQALGGQLHLRSQPGQGCLIRIVVPLP